MSPRRWTYEQCGLRLRSTFPLPLRPVAETGGFDVDVTRGQPVDSNPLPPGAVIAAMDTPDGERWYTATDAGDRLLLRFHDCGEVVISTDLTRVECRPDPTGRHDLLPVLMAGTVTAFLLLLAGRTVLHASAVAWDGAALAFVGQSGRGKTTMAALQCAAGARLVADDLLVVHPGDIVRCVGGSAELRLRDAARPLAEAFPTGTDTRVTEDARLGLRTSALETGEVELGGIVIPTPSRTATELTVTRIPAAEAVFWLLSFPRVTGMTDPDLLQRQFSALGVVAAQVPVYTAEIPWGPPFASGIATALRDLVTPGRPQLV